MLPSSRHKWGRGGESRYMSGGVGWMGWFLGKGNVGLFSSFPPLGDPEDLYLLSFVDFLSS
jgi:hypothetical protein